MSTPETADTIWELVEARAQATPDAVMLIDEADTKLTCVQLRDAALSTAAGLAAMGIGENTPVTWQLPTTIDAVVTSLALARLGALQNPILHIYRERELGVAIRRTRPELVIVPGAPVSRYRSPATKQPQIGTTCGRSSGVTVASQ